MKYHFKNEADAVEIRIYDDIEADGGGGWFAPQGISAKDIDEQLQQAGTKPLNVYINSGGGDVFEGFCIYNMIKRYTGYKTIIVDGIAASIASVIAMAGDKVVMNTASMMMIHNASGGVWGTAEDMKKIAQALEQINEVIRDVYKTRTSLDDETLRTLMDNETFMTATDCVNYGFADEVYEAKLEKDVVTDQIKILKEMKAKLEQTVKQYQDIKKIGFDVEAEGGGEAVVDVAETSNKSSHKKWDWLKMEESE